MTAIERLRLLGDKATRNPRALLLTIFILALLIRVGFVGLTVGFDGSPTYDGLSYDTFAVQLARGEGFHTTHGPTAHKPPLYPVLLSGVYILLGTSNYVAIRLSQAVLGAFTTLIVYWLAKRMLGQTVGILAGLGTTAYPLFIYMTGEIYPETLCIFLFLLLWLVAIRVSVPRPTGVDWRAVVLCGGLLGVTLLSRPNVLLFVPVLVVWPFLNLDVKTALRIVPVMLCVAALVVSPWTIRNYAVFGEFVPLSTEGGVAFWQGNNALSAGGGTLANEDTWPHPDYPDREFYGWSDLTEPESDRKFMAEGQRWIRENPHEFISLIPRKILRAWSPISFTTQSDRTASALVNVILAPYLFFLLLVAYGAVVAFKSWRVTFPLYTMPLLTTAQAALFFGGTRYSLLMAPALIVFAAVGIERLAQRLLPAPDRTAQETV